MKSVFVLLGLVASVANAQIVLAGCCQGGMCNDMEGFTTSNGCSTGTCDGFDGRSCTIHVGTESNCPNTDGSCGDDGCPIVC